MCLLFLHDLKIDGCLGKQHVYAFMQGVNYLFPFEIMFMHLNNNLGAKIRQKVDENGSISLMLTP